MVPASWGWGVPEDVWGSRATVVPSSSTSRVCTWLKPGSLGAAPEALLGTHRAHVAPGWLWEEGKEP